MRIRPEIDDRRRREGASRFSLGRPAGLRGRGGFTLLEVIVACAIFFMVAFAVLGVVTQGLAAARKLQIREPDCGMVAAQFFALTNRFFEGTESGDFEDLFPGMYRGYSYSIDILEVGSNSLFRVDFTVFRENRRKGPAETHMSTLVYGPGSPPGSASGNF